MKNHFILSEHEKKRILDLHNIKNHIVGTTLLKEQPLAWVTRIFTKQAVKKIESTIIKNLDDLYKAAQRNILKQTVKGVEKNVIKSLSGHHIPADAIEKLTKLAAQGKNPAQFYKYLPRQLADGTNFRGPMSRELDKLYKEALKKTPKISRGASTIIVGGTTLGAIAQLVGCPDIFSELLGAMKGWLSTEGPSSAHVPTPEEKENLYRFKVKYWAPVDGYPAWDNTVFKGEKDVLPSLEQFPITGHIGVTPALNINQYEEKLASQVEKHEISYNELVKRVGEYKQPLPPDLVAGKKTYKLDWGPWGVSSNEDWSTLPTSQYYIWLTPDQVKHYISVWTHYNSTTEGKAQVSNLWNLCGKGYNLKTNNCADATATSLGINTAGDGMTIPYVALEKIINKYPSQKIS